MCLFEICNQVPMVIISSIYLLLFLLHLPSLNVSPIKNNHYIFSNTLFFTARAMHSMLKHNVLFVLNELTHIIKYPTA